MRIADSSSPMNPIPFGSSGGGSSSPTALVIEPILPHLLAVLSTLSSVGFDTTVAETFQDARASLSTGLSIDLFSTLTAITGTRSLAQASTICAW